MIFFRMNEFQTFALEWLNNISLVLLKFFKQEI